MAFKRDELYSRMRVYASFFTSELHNNIMDLPDGPIIILAYLRLCALAISKDGGLYDMFCGSAVPYDARKLARVYPWLTAEQFERVLDLLTRCGMLELRDGIYWIVGFLELFGQESADGEEFPMDEVPWEVDL